MTEINENNSDTPKSDQSNPIINDNCEDSKNCKSIKINPLFILKPSILTEKAEKIRTDKEAVKNISSNSLSGNKFLVFENDEKINKNKKIDKNLPENISIIQTSSKNFIFGQNIFSRVIKSEKNEDKEKNEKEFKDLNVKNKKKDNDNETFDKKEINDIDNEKLRKNAEEITHKNPITKQLEETEIITGEEEERNVIKLSCKIFLYCNDRREWVEKGYCFVHVNDNIDKSKIHKSRLVARSKGCLKVIINSFIWADMVLDRANEKSLRITARSEEGVKSYLLRMLSSGEREALYRQLYMRKLALSSINNEVNNRKREFNSSDEEVCESKKRILSDTE